MDRCDVCDGEAHVCLLPERDAPAQFLCKGCYEEAMEATEERTIIFEEEPQLILITYPPKKKENEKE